MRILVTGAGGFIGSHLVGRLKRDGHWVRGIDIKQPEFRISTADEFLIGDLRISSQCRHAVQGIDYIYNLAADMGGIGYITSKLAEIARNNTLINLNMLDSAKEYRVKRFLFSSSACVYPAAKQEITDVRALAEYDAIPADPEPGYGWEKLYTEQLCEYYKKDYGLDVRVVRFHNVYGPNGTYDGGKEKAPAALCRKIAQAQDPGEIEVWGDGKQTRSFMYIDDCVEGLTRLMSSDYSYPLNLGTDRLVSVDDLVEIIARIAKKHIVINHNKNKPQGVRGRNSDNTNLRIILGWEPKISLEEGLSYTYKWIEKMVRRECLSHV